MDLAAFDFHLPDELIAQEPLPDRAASRMLVLHRAEARWEDRAFRDFPSYLHPGDCLVLNDSRVFPARLLGRRAGVHALPVGRNNPKHNEHLSGEAEVFLLRPTANPREWTALVHPGRKIGVGERILFPDGLECEVVARGEFGERTIRFSGEDDLYSEFDKIGHVPLPPYIKRADRADDRERYQTVFARHRGSVAAPTAGLHFTPEILEACRARGAAIASITLHVGLGTFQPLHEKQIAQSRLHSESYRDYRRKCRTHALRPTPGVRRNHQRPYRGNALYRGRDLAAGSGETEIFIQPGYRFRGAGAMLTNFHLPQTSLLMLVCAFVGTDFALAAYRHAVESRDRFCSYGDCMLIL